MNVTVPSKLRRNVANLVCLSALVGVAVGAVGCSTRAQGGTLLGGATGAAVGSMIGGGKGSTGAMLGLGLLGALVGNQLFDKPADESQQEYDRRDDDYEYRRRLRDDWRRDDYRDRDSGYYDDDYRDSRNSRGRY
jgi:hypothetical protein